MKIFINLKLSVLIFLILQNINSKAQGPCSPGVPSFTINLTGYPSGVWTSPSIPRNGLCCNAVSPDQCIYFYLTLDPNAVAIRIDMIGADPAGSLFYNIGCQGSYPGGTIKCINGPGPLEITFCKPGGNNNVYRITSISKPLFPPNDSIRVGCKHKFITYGVQNNSVVWQSIFPGTPGQYNGYLDSTNVACPTYSPGNNAPPYIDYQVCGMPIANNCGYSVTVCDTVRVYNFPALIASVMPNPASFCNTGPGSGITLTATAIGGAPTYSFTWLNTSSITVGTGSNYFASSPGNYSLVTKDVLFNANECPAFFTVVTVSQGTLPSVHAGPSQKKCAANPLASLNGSVQFATGIWSGGSGTFSPGNNYLNASYYPTQAELLAGSVKLFLTAVGTGGSCGTKKDSLMIYYSSPVVSIPPASIACSGGSTTLFSNVNGGTNPFSYSWSTGSTSPSITAGQGIFSLVVSDSLGCSGSASCSLLAPSSLSLGFATQNVSCNGGNNGTVSLNPGGGTAPYTYSWSNGATSQNIGGLTAGTYSVLLRDANNCSMTLTINITQPPVLTASALVTSSYNGQNISCYGFSNGSASVTASGGTGPYTYSWSCVPSQTTAAAINLAAGSYSVVVADFNNCLTVASVALQQPAALTATSMATSNYNGQNISCYGYSNGAASVSINGGTQPYSYTWTSIPAQYSGTATNLPAGTFSVGIADINGCSVMSTVSLSQPAPVLATAGITSNYNGQNISCYGYADGSASVTVSGGIGPYTYSWSTVPTQTNPTAVNLSAGMYTVIATDMNGCNFSTSLSLTQPSPVSGTAYPTSVFNGPNISCYGMSDGSVSVNATGGVSPYTYSWSTNPVQVTQAAGNLSAGSYTVIIADVNGCQYSTAVSLTQSPQLVVNQAGISNYSGYNVSCYAGNNGYVNLTASGGTGSYTYSWSNGAFTQNISNLSSGIYSVTVTDTNGCISTLSLNIMQPPKLGVVIDSLSNFSGFNLSCFNSTDGSVYASVNGGVPGYNYQWSNGSGNLNLTGIGAGIYSITVADQNSCNVQAEIILTAPPPILLTSTVVSPLCHGAVNGVISINLSGGVVPFTYVWSNGSVNQNISPIQAGDYHLVFADKNGCGDSTTIHVSEPAALAITKTVSPIRCYGDSLGNIQIDLAGGSSPYYLQWSNGSLMKDQFNLKKGIYAVKVHDSNGCIVNDTTHLVQPDSLGILLHSPVLFNNHNVTYPNGNDGVITLLVNGGVNPYGYLWSNTSTDQNQYNQLAGNYTVIVTDANGCKCKGSITLTDPLELEMPSAMSPNGDGKNDYFVIHGIEAYPDNELTIFNRWGNIVYSRSGYHNEWNGEGLHGHILPDATYFVVLEINSGEKVLKGFVELRR